MFRGLQSRKGSSRVAYHRRAVGYVLQYHRTHTDQGSLTNAHVLTDDGAGADVAALFQANEPTHDGSGRDHDKVFDHGVMPEDTSGTQRDLVAYHNIACNGHSVIYADPAAQVRPRRDRGSRMDQGRKPLRGQTG